MLWKIFGKMYWFFLKNVIAFCKLTSSPCRWSALDTPPCRWHHFCLVLTCIKNPPCHWHPLVDDVFALSTTRGRGHLIPPLVAFQCWTSGHIHNLCYFGAWQQWRYWTIVGRSCCPTRFACGCPPPYPGPGIGSQGYTRVCFLSLGPIFDEIVRRYQLPWLPYRLLAMNAMPFVLFWIKKFELLHFF